MSGRLVHLVLSGVAAVAVILLIHLLFVLLLLPWLADPAFRRLYVRFTVWFSVVAAVFGLVAWGVAALAGVWFSSPGEFILSLLAWWLLLAVNAASLYLAVRLLV